MNIGHNRVRLEGWDAILPGDTLRPSDDPGPPPTRPHNMMSSDVPAQRWTCEYCQRPQASINESCWSCGAPRPTTDIGSFLWHPVMPVGKPIPLQNRMIEEGGIEWHSPLRGLFLALLLASSIVAATGLFEWGAIKIIQVLDDNGATVSATVTIDPLTGRASPGIAVSIPFKTEK